MGEETDYLFRTPSVLDRKLGPVLFRFLGSFHADHPALKDFLDLIPDLSQWIERIVSQKWKKAFIFFKHEEEAKGPEMAMRFREFADSRVKKIQGRKDNKMRK